MEELYHQGKDLTKNMAYAHTCAQNKIKKNPIM